MQSAVVAGPQTFDVREEERPTAGAGRVVVRVRNCGICGSDLHFYRGEIPAAEGLRMGHEISGDVAEAGTGVSGLAQGQPVAIEPVEVCRECDFCRTGRYQLCADRKWLGTRLPGGFAEYIDVPAYTVHPLPASVPYDTGALVEPLAVAVHGLRQVRLEAGERVLVLGAGTIGLMAIVAARAMGAADVFATARYPHQLQAAEALGARAVAADDKATAALMDAFGGWPPEVVVESVGGHADTLNQAVTLVQLGGRVSLLGIYTGATPFNPTVAVLKEVMLLGGMTYGRPGPRSDFEVAIDIARRFSNEMRSIITHRVSLAEIARGFAIASDKSQRSIKVTVEMT
jgi:threonine dehydrogenase-like Zn-dependent dehydrogenase